MKIRTITLNNLRRFIHPARVGGIGDGLNVLCEPNEHGKSTLFDAIQALFFRPHGSRDKEVSSLRPHAGGAPEVTVEVETEDGRFTIAKRWFQKPAATVHRDGTLVAQADAAEAWIADLLGGDAGGPSGLIWVRQGMTDLAGGSAKEQKLALDARRDLMTSVGAEVESMTGGRRMDAALARCRAELEVYATKTGRPYANGPWKAALDAVDDLETRRETLAATARDLHDALAERKRARRDLNELEAPDAVEERRRKLEAARAAHSAALRHAEEVEAEARKVEMARLTEERARTRLEAFRGATIEQASAEKEVSEAERVAATKQAALKAQQELREVADRDFQRAQEDSGRRLCPRPSRTGRAGRGGTTPRTGKPHLRGGEGAQRDGGGCGRRPLRSRCRGHAPDRVAGRRTRHGHRRARRHGHSGDRPVCPGSRRHHPSG